MATSGRGQSAATGDAPPAADLAEIVLAHQAAFELGTLELRPAILEARSGALRDSLEPRVMQVLVALAARRGAVVTREELNQSCWGGRVVSEEALSRCILRLRRLARDLGGFEIETIPRVGYRLTERGGPPLRPRTRWRVGRWATLLLVAFVATAAVVAFTRWSARDALAHPRVEVRPFTSQTADPATTALAAAATTEVMGVLHESRVQATTGGGVSLRRPAYVVDGVVRSAGDDLFVRVRLQDASTETALWSAELTRPKSRSETLASDTAWRVASVMAVAITAQIDEGRRVDPVALGLHLAVRDGMLSANPTAVRDTVRRAPDFAWGRLAQSIYLLGRAAGASADEFESYRRAALAEAQIALRLNPRVPTYPVLAAALPTRDWAGQEKILRDGLRASPTPRSSSELAAFLANVGRPREAFEIAWRLEPASRYQIGHAVLLPYLTYVSSRGDAALKQAERTQRVRPHDLGAAYGHLVMAALAGGPGSAAAVFADPLTRPELRPEAGPAFRAFAEARQSGLTPHREAAVTAIAAAEMARAIPPGHAVLLISKLGATDAAIALAADYAARPTTLRMASGAGPSFLFAPDTAPLRADPRFISIAEQLGLVDYWRASGNWPDFCDDEPRSVCGRIRAATPATVR